MSRIGIYGIFPLIRIFKCGPSDLENLSGERIHSWRNEDLKGEYRIINTRVRNICMKAPVNACVLKIIKPQKSLSEIKSMPLPTN